MAFADNGLKIGTGLAIGFGVLILAPVVAPAVVAVARPVIKASLKSAMIFFEKASEFIAEAKESLEDLAAEAQAELAQERRQGAADSGDDSVVY